MSSTKSQQKRHMSDDQMLVVSSKRQDSASNICDRFTLISGDKLYLLFQKQQELSLPDSGVMFPWLHGFGQANVPYTEKFQLSIIRSQPLPPGMIENSGMLRSSLDLTDLFTPLNEVTQDLDQVVKVELREYRTLTGYNATILEVDELIRICRHYRLLPFLLTDTIKQYKYGNKRQIGTQVKDDGASWKRPGMFRRFDIQPAKHLELSNKVVMYCLSNGHPSRCRCHDAGVMVKWASNFVALNYLEREQNTPKIFILGGISDIPQGLMAMVPMSMASLEKPSAGQLASHFDIASFNSWDRDLLYKERLEISKMSSISMIAENVCCGNSTDVEILRLRRISPNNSLSSKKYYSTCNTIVTLSDLDYRNLDMSALDSQLFNLPSKECLNCGLYIQCVESAPLPSCTEIEYHMNQLESSIELKFPSSGSIGLGNLTLESIKSFVNICHLIHQFRKKTDRWSLIYCSDGYTETSLLVVAYLIFNWDVSLDEVLLRLHNELERPFFLFPVDLQVLGHLQLLLRELSPLRDPTRDSTLLKIDPDMFSKMFFTKPCQDVDFLRSKGPLPSRILPHLYLGSLEHAQNPNLLSNLGIKNIVSVGETLSWSANGQEQKLPCYSSACIVPTSAFGVSLASYSRNVAGPSNANLMKRNRSFSLDTLNLMESPTCKTTVTSNDGFNICHVSNLGDNGVDPMLSQLEQVLAFIDKCFQRGERVLVHCMVGVSRSATVCIAECMKRLDCGVIQAYLFVRVRRLNIIIQPNLMFIYELLKWQELKHPNAKKVDWHIMCRAIAELNKNYIKDSW
ncbi:tyrosine/serine/threonine protein phosphatase PPS1 Ecym_6282 [Eremothecium cymbalariae DBVPG|uniref:Uncharacterized protein n=1 Tax=Eremothecium cymbalariae (strain CBS 270.75 / DBVPG 7215 / KCTC 17166 / NRRL Y-17582) TaxID=931890 RepID=G8JVI3_ERECY|nr:hypothetical protein Ecym_6282 [Eremothecium cymbalariae DBVPG\